MKRSFLGKGVRERSRGEAIVLGERCRERRVKRSFFGVGVRERSRGEAIVQTWNAGDVINNYNLRY